MPVNNKIKIRRGNNIDLPSGGTESGELRYSIDTKELYIDDGSLNIKIGGDPYAFPVSSATQTALDGKQLIGTYATGTGTANGTNTGDETLTSIKTKLGAATSVSDGYLKYQDFALLHTPTTVTASNGLSISGQNISLQNASLSQSGALTFNDYNKFNSKEPAITKNTGFNKNFGTTTGTVLEGRTFGTAANSSVGDFIQNQNNTQQPANININGVGSFGDKVSFATADPTVAGKIYGYNETSTGLYGAGLKFQTRYWNGSAYVYEDKLTLNSTGAATFSSTVNSTGFLLNGNNLTSSLTTNYIPKWDGSSFINSLMYDNGTNTSIGAIVSPYKFTISTTNDNQLAINATSGAYSVLSFTNAGVMKSQIFYYLAENRTYYTGNSIFNSTTPSTLPTNGALVVGGGIGADHVRANNFYGNGSSLTGVQLPITLTTNGTSGAATFSGNVLNVPNYASSGAYVNISPSSVQSGSIWIDGIVNSSTVSAPSINTSYINFNSIPNGQQTSGSVSGNVIFNMPFNGAFYKKVIITLLNLQGSASWTFTSSFSNLPVVLNTDGLPSSIVTSKSLTSITLNCATPTSGILILEGY